MMIRSKLNKQSKEPHFIMQFYRNFCDVQGKLTQNRIKMVGAAKSNQTIWGDHVPHSMVLSVAKKKKHRLFQFVPRFLNRPALLIKINLN